MKKIAIYTCITGTYDRLIQPAAPPDGLDFICFCDRPDRDRSDNDRPDRGRDGQWQLRPLPEEACGDARERSRYPKFLPHRLLADYDFSVWMDANVGIVSEDFYALIFDCIQRGELFAAVRHPLRDDLYDEALACCASGRAAGEDMEKVCRHLLSLGWPRHSGMSENNLIFRAHNNPAVIAADEAWAALFRRFPYRDQLLLGPCLKEAGIEAGLLLPEGSDSRNHPALRYEVHSRPSRKLSRLKRELKGRVAARRLRRVISDWEDGSLAIVIPAYRGRYLARTLESLASQTNGNFRVYVGDDASPEDLRGICESFRGRLDLQYVRFDENLGGRDLVAQWKRCVELSHEDWVWLFSDDDLMQPDCVDAFLKTSRKGLDLLHFNVDVIDADGNIIESCDFPRRLSASRFVRGRLLKGLRSYAVEYVFRRSAYEAAGGFVPFDLAWNSDDASWLSISAGRPICSISGPRVQWRRSGSNISSTADSATVRRKLDASLEYLAWLRKRRLGNPYSRLSWFVTALWHFRNVLDVAAREDFFHRFARLEHLPLVPAERLFYKLKQRRHR